MRSSPDGTLVLRPASPRDGVDVWSMIREIGPGENGFHNEGYRVPFCRFGEFLVRLDEMRHGRGLPAGWVAQTTFWAFVGERPVGISKLRHRLTDALCQTGGHIGYCVRPSERGRGHGTAMLRGTLDEAAAIGIDTVLITVNEDNPASWRIVEKNGGALTRIDDGKRYYDVPTRNRRA